MLAWSSPRWFISEKKHRFFSDGTGVPIDVVCVGAIHVHTVRALRTAAVEGTQSKRELWSVGSALKRFWYIKDANSAWACKRTPSQEEME